MDSESINPNPNSLEELQKFNSLTLNQPDNQQIPNVDDDDDDDSTDKGSGNDDDDENLITDVDEIEIENSNQQQIRVSAGSDFFQDVSETFSEASSVNQQVVNGGDEERDEESVDLEAEVINNNSNRSRSSDFVRENSEIELDAAQSSPSSSGYAGERGSSSNGSVASEIEEVEENGGVHQNDDDNNNNSTTTTSNGVYDSATWVPGKRHDDEDDASMSWRKRKKHFFVLSHSGKPIYSRYGDEHKLAGFSATLQAIISFVENGGDRVKFVRAGNHQVIFLVKGPIYLVCISCTEEPHEALSGQLELIYGQFLLILTESVNRCFEKNPKFDMTPLLGGTDVVFSSLIHSFSWNPATFLHAYTCLPLAYPTRQAAGAILQDVADSGVLFAILMCKHKVVSLVGAQKASLHPDDMLLLANFVLSSESFRTSESFSPICLPRYNPMAFLYAYVHYLDADTYLIFLTTSLKSGSSSPHLGHDRPGVDSLSINPGIGGPAGLWHFIYRSINLDQYVSSEFSSPITTSKQQKRLYRAYQKLYASMHDIGIGPHKTQFRRDENYVMLCWITQDFELYAAFDPLADKKIPVKMAGRRPGDAEIVYAATDKAARELKWKAKYGITEMCRYPPHGRRRCRVGQTKTCTC